MAHKLVRQVHILPLLVVSIVFSGVFLALASAAGSVGRSLPLSQTQDFLRSYESFKPGQPISVFTQYGCIQDQNDDHCKYRMVVSQSNTPCLGYSHLLTPQNGCSEIVYALYPQTEPFHLIKVVAVNGQIRIVDFYSNSLTADSLFYQWGDPDSVNHVESGIHFRLVWQHQGYTATVTVSHSQRIARLITLAVNGT